jgi:hypothetical protein
MSIRSVSYTCLHIHIDRYATKAKSTSATYIHEVAILLCGQARQQYHCVDRRGSSVTAWTGEVAMSLCGLKSTKRSLRLRLHCRTNFQTCQTTPPPSTISHVTHFTTAIFIRHFLFATSEIRHSTLR